MSEDEHEPHELLRLIARIARLFRDLLEWFEQEKPGVRIVPLDKEGNPMTVAPAQPFPIHDNQSLPLGLALEGDNPNALTIASAVWSDGAVVALTQTPPALTAEAMATSGTEGTAMVTAVVTLSDGSTLTTPAFEIAVTAAPVPLSAVIVPGTPTP